MSPEIQAMPTEVYYDHSSIDPNDERIRPFGFGGFGRPGFGFGGFGRPGFGFGGFGRPGFGFGGFGRPFGFGFGRPWGWGFGAPWGWGLGGLGLGLLAGAALSPAFYGGYGYGYGYPYYPPIYPYGGLWY